MTRKKFKLNTKEQVQRKILNIIIVFIVLIIIKGIYNQSNNIDQDNILFPFFLILSIIFCAIYSFNAFTSGNIVRNWSSIRIFTTIYNYLIGKRNF
jgi:ABC-type multidrug transport system permease subunit